VLTPHGEGSFFQLLARIRFFCIVFCRALYWRASSLSFVRRQFVSSAVVCFFFVFCSLQVHFGYIYGFGVVGCLLMYVILNLMADEAISVDRTMSILGYSLLPIVLLALAGIVLDLRGALGLCLALLVIGWCTVNATRLFEKALSMTEQRYLVAYPVTMLYACFALLTIF
jgi:hypothetical protein